MELLMVEVCPFAPCRPHDPQYVRSFWMRKQFLKRLTASALCCAVSVPALCACNKDVTLENQKINNFLQNRPLLFPEIPDLKDIYMPYRSMPEPP